MKLELRTSFLFGLLIGLLLVLIFGKPRKAATKPATKQEPAKAPPRRAPDRWRHRPGARTYSGKGRTIDVEAQQAEFEAETEALDQAAFAPINRVWESLASRKAKMEQQEKVAQA